MKQFFYLFFCPFFFFYSCNNKEKAEKSLPTEVTKDNAINQPENPPEETPKGIYLVTENAVVILLPKDPKVDSLKNLGKEINKTKKGNSTNAVRNFAISKNYRLIESNEDIIDFEKQDGKITRITREEANADVILFNPKREPLYVDAGNFNKKEATAYFEDEKKEEN